MPLDQPDVHNLRVELTDAGQVVSALKAPAGPHELDLPEVPAYDGHHIQVYVANFSGPHRALLERGAQVIAWGKAVLDQAVPLATGSWAEWTGGEASLAAQ